MQSSRIYSIKMKMNFNRKNLLRRHQVALVMDPAHLISPPRAHPSGISSGESIHGESILNEPWFMIAIVIVLVVLLMSAAFTLRFLYRRRKNLSKGLQHHLSGELTFAYLLIMVVGAKTVIKSRCIHSYCHIISTIHLPL